MRRYLIRIENSQRYKPAETIQLLIKLRKCVDEYRSVVKNLRVTEIAIEFDLYFVDEYMKMKSLDNLGKEFGLVLTQKDLENEQTIGDAANVIELGIKLFNEERFWECHETVEQLWRKTSKGPEKDVQQGFILAASALVHFQKDEPSICLGMIPRTLSKLNQWNEQFYHKLDVNALKDNLNNILASGNIVPFKV